MFAAQPRSQGGPTTTRLRLAGAGRRAFTGSAEWLADAGNRADIGEYMTDMARPYALDVPPELFSEPSSTGLGHSYGEMAEALLGEVVLNEPVDLLVLAFAIHDMRPGRATATYLSHVCPGTPMSLTICDQGTAAAFSALTVASAYAAASNPVARPMASSAGCRRALIIVVEQATLPYKSDGLIPAEHRAVAMLFEHATEADDQVLHAVRQHPAVPADRVAELASSDLAAFTADGDEVDLVVSHTLAAAWPEHPRDRVTVAPAGAPSTGVWWELVGGGGAARRRVVVADYDPDLRYLSVVALG